MSPTHLLGLSLRPPREDRSWPQHRMYRISPFLLNRLSSACMGMQSAAWVAGPSGPLRLASIRGQHPPTQWL